MMGKALKITAMRDMCNENRCWSTRVLAVNPIGIEEEEMDCSMLDL